MSKDLQPGTILHETYRIIRTIGVGGMGTVYEAQRISVPMRVAIKVMHEDLDAASNAVVRFQREAQRCSALKAPYFVRLIDFNYLPNGRPFMVMEYLEGEDLGRRLDAKQRLPMEEGVHIISEVAKALAIAHEQQILHRDIKPANIFLARWPDGSETVKLLDFGASKRGSRPTDLPETALTTTGTVVGTPWYMSPEQAQGEELDLRSDLFSLAIVAYESLTGRLPFEAASAINVVMQILESPFTPIRTHLPAAPAALDAFFGRALDKTPANRFATADEFASILRSVFSAKPHRDPTTDVGIERPLPPTIQVPALAETPPWRLPVIIGLLMLAALAAGGLVAFLQQPKEGGRPPATSIPAGVPPPATSPVPAPRSP